MHTATKKGGFTLVETLTYGAGLLIILVGVMIFTAYLFDWYRSATIPTRADQMAIALMNRVSNDIRGANSLNDPSSIYNSLSGAISMTTTSGETSTTTAYALQGGVLKYKINANATTTISSDDVWVSGFYVKKLATPVSTAVHIELSVDYAAKTGTTTSIYSGLAVLRQSYQ